MSRSNSTKSTSRSNDSKRRWKQPKTAEEFANQVNAVTTMLLNGEIDIMMARRYQGLARVLAQTLSVEVSQNRMLKRPSELLLSPEVYEDE